MEKMNGSSMDLVDENIQGLKQLCPEVFTEGKIDFEKLKLLFGDNIDEKEERYELRWNGKTSSIKLSQTPTMGTLRPDKKSSKNWSITENLYIEGDNLEVLKLLQKSYFGKIKMIYIDPPYNTGGDFVYKDDFRDNIKNYKETTGQSTRANTESNGRYHTDWLNMIYPRLKLARNLLTDDGAIFMSIDDNEVSNIRKVCDEIFGEDNFIGEIIVQSNKGGQDYKDIAKTHEYLICYSKSENTSLLELEKEDANLKYCDNNGSFDIRELRNRNPKFGRFNRPNLFYPIYVNSLEPDKDGLCKVSLEKKGDYNVEVLPYNSQGKESCWRWGTTKLTENVTNNILDSNVVAKQKSGGGWNIYEKYRKTTQKVKTIWDETNVRTENGTIQLRELGLQGLFDHPKPTDIIEKCIKMISDENDVILDFFSGSATTAHAVMKLNIEDTNLRKFILVQLPEVTDENSEAFKAGYKNICEIGEERIRRAGEKIKEENKDKEGIETLDVGFKVFKLDDSNIKTWNPDYNELEQDLLDMQDSLKEGRTKEDLLFEIILKMGFELTTPIEEVKVGDKVIYNISEGALIICLEDSITEDILNKIPGLKSEFMRSDEVKVIFKEKGFKNDKEKMNAIQNLKQQGITNVRSV